MNDDMMSRRSFLFMGAAATATVATATVPRRESEPVAATMDPNLSVFISDLHAPGPDVPLDDKRDEAAPTAMYDHLVETVDRILAMRPLPARVIELGDLAYLRGRLADYRHSAPVLRRLEAAGIELVLGLGNHDHRKAFAEVWPEHAAKSPVPGFIVRDISLGEADLVLLDTLHENPGEGAWNNGDGLIGDEQAKWMVENLAKRQRPFVLCGHHSCRETKMGKERLYDFIMRTPKCRGYIHGHDHAWGRRTLLQWYGAHSVKREVSVPSTGFFGDIGYVVCRTGREWMDLMLVQTDFYFRTYRSNPADRPVEWAQIVRENEGESCRLRLI